MSRVIHIAPFFNDLGEPVYVVSGLRKQELSKRIPQFGFRGIMVQRVRPDRCTLWEVDLQFEVDLLAFGLSGFTICNRCPCGHWEGFRVALSEYVARGRDEFFCRTHPYEPDETWVEQMRGVSQEDLCRAAALLGLTWPCSKEDLRRAFSRAALQAHPDVGGTNEAMRKLVDVRERLQKAISRS